MATVKILQNEIFGNLLGTGYAADVSKTDLLTRNYLLRYTPKYEYGRPFFKNLEHDYIARYTMLLLPKDANHVFLSKDGRDGAYLGISLRLSEPIPDDKVIKLLNRVLDCMCGDVYAHTPNGNLQYLTANLYGNALALYTETLAKNVKHFNDQEIGKTPIKNIFNTLDTSVPTQQFQDYSLYRFPTNDTLAKATNELKNIGVENYDIVFNDTIAIPNDEKQKYLEQLYEKNKTILLKMPKQKSY